MQGLIARLMDPDMPRASGAAGNFKMTEGSGYNAEQAAYMAERAKKIEAIGGPQKVAELRNQARSQGMGFFQAARWANQQINSLYAARNATPGTTPPASTGTPAASPAPTAGGANAPALAPTPSPTTGAAPAPAPAPSAQQTALQGTVGQVTIPNIRERRGMISSLMRG